MNGRIIRGIFGWLVICVTGGEAFACSTAPTAKIVSPSDGQRVCVGASVSFNGVGSGSTGSYDYDNGAPHGGGKGITQYEWDWGDPTDPGWHIVGGTPSHAYSDAGEYAVKLRVTDDDSPSQTHTTPLPCTVVVMEVKEVVENWPPESPGPLYKRIGLAAGLNAKPNPSGSPCGRRVSRTGRF